MKLFGFQPRVSWIPALYHECHEHDVHSSLVLTVAVIFLTLAGGVKLLVSEAIHVDAVAVLDPPCYELLVLMIA